MTRTTNFCQECGASLVPESQFCEECGKAVAATGFTNFTRVRELFDQAAEIPTASREAWLAGACGEDAALLQELRGMLANQQDSFMAQPVAMPPGVAPPSTPPPAATVGPYRLIRELGRGGMGVVYLAMRDDGTFRKNVALKLLLQDKVTPEFVQRFKQERQVLAAVEHPNIARILDAGDAPDGMPYYVMEFVDGVPMDQYCDTQRLSMTERIKLFQQVCHAVHCLHQLSIVHRDLKPRNILVNTEGAVKLLDFGIAKVVGAGSFANPDLSSVQGSPMTPVWASPEQIIGATLQKTTDIYSLGVILYNLLTGRSPYDGWKDKQEKLATRQEPQRPSQNIREDLRATPESTAQLRRAMMGALDSIVLKALRYDPRERYQSAAELAEELDRFLTGKPVEAHHESVGGRSIKLIKRKRAMIAVFAGFLALGGFGGWQWWRVEQRNREVAAREAEIRRSLEQLESGIEATKPDEERIKDLRELKKAFVEQMPTVAAGQPGKTAQHEAMIERGVRYLDRLAAHKSQNTDLALELSDSYQQLAGLEANVIATPASRKTAVGTYQKAANVLSKEDGTPSDDARVAERLAMVRKRIESMGGATDAGESKPEPAKDPPLEERKVEKPVEKAALPVKVPAAKAAQPKPAPPPVQAKPEKPPVEVAAVGGAMQDRLIKVQRKVGVAQKAVELRMKDLASRGQRLDQVTLTDSQMMQGRLNRARKKLAEGNEAEAAKMLDDAQAFADRVLKTVQF